MIRNRANRSLARCLLLVLFTAATVLASEAGAVAISRNIQARHLPWGTITDPVYASPSSNQIVNYTRCGDSAIWTGHYLAAEAYRYAVTGSAESFANVQGAVAGIQSLVDQYSGVFLVLPSHGTWWTKLLPARVIVPWSARFLPAATWTKRATRYPWHYGPIRIICHRCRRALPEIAPTISETDSGQPLCEGR